MFDLNKLWTPASPQAYTVLQDNVAVGVGALSVWDSIPGAWNILAMTYVDLPGLLSWKGTVEDFPANLHVVPHCVGTALQLDGDFHPLGEATERMTPLEFLDYVAPLKNQLIMSRVFGEAWWEVAQHFAEEYRPRQSANVFSIAAKRAEKGGR